MSVHLPAKRRVKRVSLASPDHDDISLTAGQEGNVVRFTLPEVKVYEIAVIEY
ncbi:MAG: hypothetical protein JXM70_29885 [Pirellulales bacterium]|nr:hypothetical protein [Pirellulales bacterium]